MFCVALSRYVYHSKLCKTHSSRLGLILLQVLPFDIYIVSLPFQLECKVLINGRLSIDCCDTVKIIFKIRF